LVSKDGLLMIIVKMIGGLGNQMFQYAFGRSLSIKNKTELYLDLSFFHRQTDKRIDIRHFNLNNFNIKAQVASAEQVFALTRRTKIKSIDRILNKVIGRKFSFLYYDFPNYKEELRQVPDNTYLEGFFQSYKYFDDIQEVIRTDFLPKVLVPKLKSGEGRNTVSIHIRRGDYIGNSTYSICNLQYYLAGINYLSHQVGEDIHYIIFSDDEKWVNTYFVNQLKLDSFTVIEGDKSNPVNDLYLMSQCDHNIIANSTFSWWGAWLNKNPIKVIVAPKKWFNNSNFQSSNVIPESWIQL
jgi:hypothetical protein